MSTVLAMLWLLFAPARAASCEDKGGVETTKDECIDRLAGRYVWFNDEDGDDYNAETICCCDTASTCDATGASARPDGYEDVVSRTRVDDYGWDDCQDDDSDVNPGAEEIWYDDFDQDCDSGSDFDQDGDGHDSADYEGEDCDDTDEDVFPGADEAANTTDDDCDGTADEGTTAYDDDGDCACEDETCTDGASADCVVLLGGDCDDSDPDVAPDAVETWYDGYDQDCDSASDYDQDADGYVPDAYLGLETTVAGTDKVVERGELPGGDCEDGDPSFSPGVEDAWYDGLDVDCGEDDDYDQDADGYVPTGYAGLATTLADGSALAGSGSLPEGDCDDGDDEVSPGAEDAWYDGIEQNCDESCDFDQDGDGYAIDPALIDADSIPDTVRPDGTVICTGDATPDGDCSDEDADTNPGATETWYDGYDQDCGGESDYDQDGDGYVQDEHVGLSTTIAATGEFVERGHLEGGDCDDTDATAGPGTADSWYDGVDADCGEDDDYDQDYDGYVPTAYAGLSTLAPDGEAVAGTGALPDGDCDDEDASVSPGADESWYDGFDQDCDGGCDYDQDGDGYSVDPALVDLDSIPDTTQPDGTVVCAGDAIPDGDCVDDEETLYDLDPTSTKDPADIHPDTDETCEVKDGIQIDDDCNGSTNTQGEGDEETFITSDWGTPYYRDADGDGQGDPDTEFYLCEDVDGFTTSFGDCDDTNADVNPDAPEICNNADEDCDGQIDESSSLGDESGCIDLYPDQDLDGYGDSATTNCMCYDGSSDECGDGYEYNDEDEICYTRTYGDCYDFDGSIHPIEDGEPQVEYLDGDDNDCNGELPLVELDCDDDGSLPLLPVSVLETDEVASAGELGLTDCRGPSLEADPDCCLREDCEDGETCDDLELTEFVTCWDEYRLRLKCDEETGLVVVSQVADGVAERFDGGRRLYAEGRVCTTAGDCDDHCAARCPDQTEACDGVDNDCADADALLGDSDDDGIPDPLDEDEEVPGYVNVSELDLDADGYLGCDVGDLVQRDQDALSLAACTSSDALADCNNTCSLSSPVVEEERCDGFLGVCEGEAEGLDADRDAHLTCGAWGPEDGELAEDIYVLVYVPEATGADSGETAAADEDDQGEVVPLLLPRPEAPECDSELHSALSELIGEDTLDRAVRDGDTNPLLELCAAAEACRLAREEGTSLDWPASCEGLAGACSVARLTLSATADDEAYDDDVVARLDAVADCSAHPEQVISRTVWSHARVLSARALVVQWECFRLDGTYGCGDLAAPEGWESPYPDGTVEGGNFTNADPGDALSTDPRWWKELSRYNPEPMLEALLTGCWGDPDPGTDALSDVISRQTGGDCADGAAGANRGVAEGPDDLLGLYLGEPADCATCTDGRDNNCNGLMDCAEPACARCFVAQGSGCGGGEQSPCAESGCVTTPRDLPPTRDAGAIALLGILLTAIAQRLRRQA